MSDTQEPDPLHEPVRHERYLIAKRLRELKRCYIDSDDGGYWNVVDHPTLGSMVRVEEIETVIKELES